MGTCLIRDNLQLLLLINFQKYFIKKVHYFLTPSKKLYFRLKSHQYCMIKNKQSDTF